MHIQVELTTLIQLLAPVFAILLGINGYFIRGLVLRIEETARLAASSAEKITQLEKDASDTKAVLRKIADHASQIDSDVAVLKFAILNQIKKMEIAARGEG